LHDLSYCERIALIWCQTDFGGMMQHALLSVNGIAASLLLLLLVFELDETRPFPLLLSFADEDDAAFFISLQSRFVLFRSLLDQEIAGLKFTS